MRVLCITQNLPGELDPMAACLAANPENTVFMASLRQRHNAPQPGIRRIILKKCNAAKYEKNYLGYWQLAINTAANAEKSFSSTLRQDFYPDIILACASNGIAFAVPRVFAKAFLVSYADTRLLDFPVTGEGFFACRRAVQACQFMQSQLGFYRYQKQLEGLCGVNQQNLAQLPPFVDCDFFSPQYGAQTAQSLAIISGVLNERQLAIFWNQLKELLGSLPGCRVTLLAEGGLLGWRWEDMAANLPEKQRQRLGIEYSPLNAGWRDILRENAFLLCPNADISVSQRLLEAMSGSVPILAGISSLDYIKFGLTALGFQLFADQSLTAMTRQMFNKIAKGELLRICANARAHVVENYDQKKILPPHIEFILDAWRKYRQGTGQGLGKN